MDSSLNPAAHQPTPATVGLLPHHSAFPKLALVSSVGILKWPNHPAKLEVKEARFSRGDQVSAFSKYFTDV